MSIHRKIATACAPVVMAAALLSGQASAQDGGVCAATTSSVTDVYFVNGEATSLAQARSARNALRDAYAQSSQSQFPGQSFNFTLAYNYSGDVAQSLIGEIDQAVTELGDDEASSLVGGQYLALFNNARNFLTEVPAAAEGLLTGIAGFQASRLVNPVEPSSLIQKFRTDLQEGRRVVLMAHGRGNLFATEAINTLADEFGTSIGMIGLASPASSLPINGNATYYTAQDDLLINTLRNSQDVLPANVDNNNAQANQVRDDARTQFQRSYFSRELPSRTMIDADFGRLLSTLQFPASDLGSGAMTVTLTWGEQPDLDLHVFEPDGTHVFYANRRGNSGFLDQDDVSSFGPEHYFADCDILQTGVYRVAVNYFSGPLPEVARIQISTADGNTRTFTQPLERSVGSSGNNSPILVATIDVSIGPGNRFIFDVM